MSPEQSRIAPLDARSDVFSLGSVLFELAVGEPPFGDDHTPGTLDKLRKSDPDRLARLLVNAEIPSWLTQVILGCLRREPDDRYPTAAAVADALDEGMRRAGVVQSIVREALARRATAVNEQLGPLHPAEPLPPLITSDPTGSHHVVPQAGFAGSLPGWLRGLGMATAGALVVLLGLFGLESFEAFDRGSARASDNHWIPSLASDLELRGSDSSPAPTNTANTQADTPRDEPASTTKQEPLAQSSTASSEDDVVLEPAQKRKRPSTHSRDPLEEFKSNPYD
jgi:serine/threonine-protein kinase